MPFFRSKRILTATHLPENAQERLENTPTPRQSVLAPPRMPPKTFGRTTTQLHTLAKTRPKRHNPPSAIH